MTRTTWTHGALAILGATYLSACFDRAPADPVATGDTITTTENVAGSVDVLANDSPDGDVSVSGYSQPTHGTVAVSGSVATYTPTTGYVGADSFTYTIDDSRGGSDTGTVSVTVSDQAPVATDDALAAIMSQPSSMNVLTNDSDPDGDMLTVTAFTQGAHGTVAFAGGVATYTPATGYSGSDSFTYTVDDGHGATATGDVTVTVTNPVPGCTISISGPASGVYGQNLHFTATAACNTGAAQVQWYHRTNSSYVIVQPWSATQTLDFTADAVGPGLFYAQVRTQGGSASQGASNTVSVAVADNAPQCTAVHVTAPTANQMLQVGVAQTLTATSTCPVGATAEYQFWIKPSTTTTWTVLPGYTTGSSSWTPGGTGAWNVKAVVRAVGAHVTYQLASATVSVTVLP
jgi:hypothetical protein